MRAPAHKMPQRGFTLIELSIAILISLFLVGGLLSLVIAMKRTNTNQGGLSQLQDEERVAMTLITDVVQSAGYFPNPVANSLTSMFPVISGSFATAGQTITGTGSGTAAAPGDTITIRYATAGTTAGDNTINCLGATSTVAVTFINKFALDGSGNLQCTLTIVTAGVAGAPTTTTLVTGVQNLQIVYGVQTNSGSGNQSADTYLDAPAMTAGNYWPNVVTVSVTLVFTNPLAGQAGQTSTAKATIPFTRVIGVMNKAGVNT